MSGYGAQFKNAASRFDVRRVAWMGLLSLALVACSGDKMDDLRAYVEATKAKPGGRVEPIPEVKPFESFVYQVAGRKSPFEPWTANTSGSRKNAVPGTGPAPDDNRRKEALESFPLDTLRMVGTLAQKDGMWAIVKAPDGLVYRVTRNNYMGQNHGRVTRVSEDRIDLTEIIPDGLGGWQERQAGLALAE